MSETLLVAIIGVGGTIVGAIIGGLVTYLVARVQWKKDMEAAQLQWAREQEATKAQWEREREMAQEAQMLQLRDYVLSNLTDSLTPLAIERSNDAHYIDELRETSQRGIKHLYVKGVSEKMPHLCRLSDQLANLMRGYFEKLIKYGDNRVTKNEIEVLRQNTKEQVGNILGSVQITQVPNKPL